MPGSNSARGAAIFLLSVVSVSAQSCSPSFTVCKPTGASATSIPTTGPELAPLYNDLLDTVKGIHFRRDANTFLDHDLESRDTPSFCCIDGTHCLNLAGFDVPMCYDPFTTNFILPDGSSGTIDSGAFTGHDGGTANLRNGSYTAADGDKSSESTGDLYTGSGATASPTNSGAIPTPFTGTGQGSAIPLTALGGVQTFIITVPATTVPGTTVTPETAPSTVAGTTREATTVPAHTTLVTSSVLGASALASSTSSAAAGNAKVAGAGLAGLVAALALL